MRKFFFHFCSMVYVLMSRIFHKTYFLLDPSPVVISNHAVVSLAQPSKSRTQFTLTSQSYISLDNPLPQSSPSDHVCPKSVFTKWETRCPRRDGTSARSPTPLRCISPSRYVGNNPRFPLTVFKHEKERALTRNARVLVPYNSVGRI